MSAIARIRVLAGVIALAAAGLVTGTAPAHAAGPTVQFIDDYLGYCNAGYAGWPVTVDGVTGWFHCGSLVMQVTWVDGHEEYFGAGTNLHVYHILPGWTSWSDIDGRAYDMKNAYYNSSDLPTVEVIGTDYNYWCSWWTGSSWRSWYLCNT